MPAHTATRVAKLFGIAPTGRYARYLANKEWDTLDGRWALLPTYASALKLAASGKAFETLLANGVDGATLGGAGGWVPLAAIGSEESQFLVVRATGEEGAVAMWEHETGRFVPVAPALDAFVASTGASKAKAKAAEPVVAKAGMGIPALWKLVQHAVAVADKGAGTAKKRAEMVALLAQLEPELPALPTKAMVADTPYQRLPGHAHHARGKLLRALGRFEEACAAMDGAMIDGVRSNVAPDLVCEIWFADLDRPQQVLELVRAAAKPSLLMRRMAALAMLRLGDTDGAVAELDRVVARRIESTLALEPELGHAAVVAQQRALLAKAVGEYAAKHGIQREAALMLARVTFA